VSMTDQEVVCAWMETRPKDGTHPQDVSEIGWWKAVYTLQPQQRWRWFADGDKTDSLDALWEVEERLTDQQWGEYWKAAAETLKPDDKVRLAFGEHFRYWSHLDAEQKIKALASVLRPIVENKEPLQS
jgi:hypothetical protein